MGDKKFNFTIKKLRIRNYDFLDRILQYMNTQIVIWLEGKGRRDKDLLQVKFFSLKKSLYKKKINEAAKSNFSDFPKTILIEISLFRGEWSERLKERI